MEKLKQDSEQTLQFLSVLENMGKDEALQMMKMPLSVVPVAVFCLPLTLLTSCGSGSEGVQNTIINLDPPGLGQATTVGFTGSNGQIFRIEVRSPTGNAQIGVNVTIDSQYIVYAGRPIIDCATTPCTAVDATPVTLPYTTTTDQFGYAEVTVVYSWNIPPVVGTKGDFTAVEAFSGTGYGNANITFTCSDPDGPAIIPNCPT